MVQVGDKFFEEYLTASEIESIVKTLAKKIDTDYSNKPLMILGILNGSFLFLADLVRHLNIDPEISFAKFASYEGTNSTGQVRELVGIDEDISGKHILIVEDIVDSGTTLAHITNLLKAKQAAEISVATLFFKPEAYKQSLPLQYVGKEIPNLFVVGYGMDYNGKGRNLMGLYQLKH